MTLYVPNVDELIARNGSVPNRRKTGFPPWEERLLTPVERPR
jgi:hypothetical protein